MNEVFLYTFPQWVVFGALFGVIYGWVESKKAFRITGNAIFLLLGIFAAIVLAGGFLATANYLTPNEVASEELDDVILNEVPLQAKLIPAYWNFLLSGILAIPTIILDWKNKKYSRTLMVVTGLVALMGFFVIVGALRQL